MANDSKTIIFLGNFGVDFSSESHHAKSLEALGHKVIRLQEGGASSGEILKASMGADLFIWVHTHGWRTPEDGMSMIEVLNLFRRMQLPTITYHLDLWFGLERQKDLEQDPFYKMIDYFFTCDKQMADWFNKETDVKGVYMPAGVFGEEVYKAKSDGFKHDVIFVGSKGYHPEWQWRPQLIDWLSDTYGSRFVHYGGDGAGVVRGADLNQLYADTKVVVGDSLNIGFDYPHYWSDRLYETTGRGGFIIFPKIKGLDEEFELGKELITYDYGDFDKLKGLIDFYIKHDKPREMVRERGFKRTKNNHTYKHRWQKILEIIDEKPLRS